MLWVYFFCIMSLMNVEPHHHHHHHVPEGLGMLACSLILKMKLVPPSLPRSSYVSSCFWFILQCLFWQSVCVHPLYMLQPLFMVLFYFLYCVLCSSFLPNTLILSLSSFVIPSRCLKNFIVLLPNVVPLFSSVPKLHFQISMLLQL